MDECNVHRECRLSDAKELGTSLVVFGEIVAASIWDEALKAEPNKRYELLDQMAFLGMGCGGGLKEGNKNEN